eukprot:TRINITY_DN620_c0_g1_i17.p1 TRINITY_DN620_c0_g1~~TRINITY_DN620_c0_g1_i17.p1  ORF type:complete len:171 (-),score=19.16 TRINITY_DN620_c0_g1_i17:102-614(-)
MIAESGTEDNEVSVNVKRDSIKKKVSSARGARKVKSKMPKLEPIHSLQEKIKQRANGLKMHFEKTLMDMPEERDVQLMPFYKELLIDTIPSDHNSECYIDNFEMDLLRSGKGDEGKDKLMCWSSPTSAYVSQSLPSADSAPNDIPSSAHLFPFYTGENSSFYSPRQFIAF